MSTSTIKKLPEPLSARELKLIARSVAPEKPDMHGCGYFDGAPWDICYACEYERDPATYQAKIQRSANVEKISAYFHNVTAGAQTAGWSSDTIATVVAELDNPRDKRTYTDEQLADEALAAEAGSLLAGLRALLPYC
jgi:hypothetical protein